MEVIDIEEIKDLEGEIWRDVVGYEGYYQVSNFGRVKSVTRQVSNHTGMVTLHPHILKVKLDFKGYARVYLSKNAQDKYVGIHRLVAMSFIPNIDNKPQVNHIDGNKTNNNVNNLEWCTNRENAIHAIKLGLNDHSTYESGRKKRPVLQINPTTNNIIAEYPSISDAGRAIGIKTSSNIGGCCRGEYGRQTIKGYKWKFKNEGGDAK